MVHIFASARSASSGPTPRLSDCAHPAGTGSAGSGLSQPGSDGAAPHTAPAGPRPGATDSHLRWAALDSKYERLVDATHPLLDDLAGE